MSQSEDDSATKTANLDGPAGRLPMDSGQFVGMSVGQSVGDSDSILCTRRDKRR